MTSDRVPAVGGVRTVPRPDDIARDYLLLALRLDQHLPGTVDGYFGPADLKARVDIDQPRSPAALADDAAALRDRVERDVPELDRRAWLQEQLIALETQARVRAGDAVGYLDLVTRCFAFRPQRRPDARFETAAAELDALLPGSGPLAERLAAEDDLWTVPPDRVPAVVARLVEHARARASDLFVLPDGEDLRVTMVRGQPWSGYNWYDGGYRSRVDINLDLPIRLPSLLDTVAHETYPGHHLENARKEEVLVEAKRRLEASALLVNTPQCLISEGVANLGREFAVSPAERAGLLAELAPLAGLPLSTDAAALREAAAREGQVHAIREILDEASLNAALRLHLDGESREAVLAYLLDVGRFAPAVAARRLEFVEHPLWRTYVVVYAEGEALLRRWLDAVPEAARAARFARLLEEPLTPPVIEAELAVPSPSPERA